MLGDTVNIASRLESSVAKPGMVVIGREHLSRWSRDQFECKSMGSFTLKGKEKVVSVYEVAGPAPRMRPTSPPGRLAGGLRR